MTYIGCAKSPEFVLIVYKVRIKVMLFEKLLILKVILLKVIRHQCVRLSSNKNTPTN